MVTIPGRPNHLANLAISVVVAKIQPATSADFASQLSKKSESSFRAHDRNAYALNDSQLVHRKNLNLQISTVFAPKLRLYV